jgi:hypothetical protein
MHASFTVAKSPKILWFHYKILHFSLQRESKPVPLSKPLSKIFSKPWCGSDTGWLTQIAILRLTAARRTFEENWLYTVSAHWFRAWSRCQILEKYLIKDLMQCHWKLISLSAQIGPKTSTKWQSGQEGVPPIGSEEAEIVPTFFKIHSFTELSMHFKYIYLSCQSIFNLKTREITELTTWFQKTDE